MTTGFINEQHGFTTASAMTVAIITDMLANGFTQVFPDPGTPFVTSPPPTAPFKVTLEASKAIDPLNDPAALPTQAWRIQFNVISAQQVFVYVGTSVQLPSDGTAAILRLQGTDGSTYYYDIAGSIGAQVGTTDASGKTILSSTGAYTNTAKIDETTKGFVNRPLRIADANGGSAFPLAYRLVLTPRGMWLGSWEEATTQSTGDKFNWMLIQRPVDRTTGATLVTGKAPVFCINSVEGLYWQFVVRENDVLKPSDRRIADSNTVDSEAVLNTQNQVSLSEDGKYIVTFPSRLNTARYRYPHELDMMGVTSADVVSQFSDVPLQFYSETTSRTYKAMQANNTGNTGMRILVLSAGGGIG